MRMKGILSGITLIVDTFLQAQAQEQNRRKH